MIVQGDAQSLPLADDSVDLIVTSPPYFAMRSYRDADSHYEGQLGSETSPDDFLAALWAATSEMIRVLKPTGSIFVNLGDKYAGSVIGGQTFDSSTLSGGKRRLEAVAGQTTKRDYEWGACRTKSLMGLPWRYAIGCIDQLQLILRAEIIWAKTNALPERAPDRVRRVHEQWFHFVKQPTYYFDTTIAMLQSVWSVPTEALVVPTELGDHFAAFPTEMPRRCILGWSPDGGTVLDPFGGTGTTALVAKTLGRKGISVDLSHDYCCLAKWRVNESGHGKKALSRTWAERQEGLAV